MVKKRADKRTHKYSYKKSIWSHVFTHPGSTKDKICSQVKGSRSVVFTAINNLIDEKILEYRNGVLFVSNENDLERKRSALAGQLKLFREVRNNILVEIKNRIKNSSPLQVGEHKIPTNLFFYRTDFTFSKTSSVDVTEEIWHINDEAKEIIFQIPQQIDQIVRGSFSLYTSYMMYGSISDESYKGIFEDEIKEVLVEIKKTKKMLLNIMLEFSDDKKRDKAYFEGWWWQLTAGLNLDHEEFPKPEDIKWDGEEIL